MATAVTVAVVGARDQAKEFGSKGTASDVTLFHAVRDGHALTVIEPTQFPEKFAPLLVALGMADRTLLVVDALGRDVAESAAAVDLFEAPVELVLGPAVGEAEVRRALKGTRLESAPAAALDYPKLRATLDGWTAPASPGGVLVRLDHAFPVKGVGAVALGVVRRGTLKAHEKLRLYPSTKTVEVRSIQVHDVDVPSAETAERVGMALKGVEADEISRGQVLAPEGSLHSATTLSAHLDRPCRYYRGTISEGLAGNILIGLQFVPARVTGGAAGGPLTVETDRPVAYLPGDAAVFADLSAAPGPRVAGRLRIDGP
ncbi:MAG TPA: EF-Tu/IF-2/RF-3 family GTPase [Thermoplasmata archaeon]|nr:EF-Tu/IF-2/RF-3 family GTPase [Thermoplasmata archaeon]